MPLAKYSTPWRPNICPRGRFWPRNILIFRVKSTTIHHRPEDALEVGEKQYHVLAKCKRASISACYRRAWSGKEGPPWDAAKLAAEVLICYLCTTSFNCTHYRHSLWGILVLFCPCVLSCQSAIVFCPVSLYLCSVLSVCHCILSCQSVFMFCPVICLYVLGVTQNVCPRIWMQNELEKLARTFLLSHLLFLIFFFYFDMVETILGTLVCRLSGV